MTNFKLRSNYKLTVDQNNALNKLILNYKKGFKFQVLLGVTGSGKTFTAANFINQIRKPTLIISHNKTLAAQLYQEFREYFPENAISYFVSYYDYYQPEAYIPSTDTYIEKDSDINELIDKLRLATTVNLLTRDDTIVIASVSCIYNIGSPKEYENFTLKLSTNSNIERNQIIDRLVDLQYERGDFGFHRGTFRVIGETIDIYPSYIDDAVRLNIENGILKDILLINSLSGEVKTGTGSGISNYVIYPAKHFITDPKKNRHIFKHIISDMEQREKYLINNGKLIEANRIRQKVTYDLQMIKELGYVKGIENYSRYFDGRSPGDTPYSLINYYTEKYKNDWLLFVDESHITFPQIRGMYNGDLSRKQTLIDYGFRLPAALDNRPLKFEEFLRIIPGFIATSATPSDWELSIAKESARKIVTDKNLKEDRIILDHSGVVEQLLRPTGILDPKIIIKPTKYQVRDVVDQISQRLDIKKHQKKQRTLVTTLTKKTAEHLTDYLKERGIQVQYLHSDIKTLERTDILDKLRKGEYDCIVGVNLLREGLDLPEVGLVAILDADKEGFLRSKVSLIQTMGRAARNVDSEVILYADKITGSISQAISEVNRRRSYQILMNKKYKIIPRSIEKPFRENLTEYDNETPFEKILKSSEKYRSAINIDILSLTQMDKKRLIKKLRTEMKLAAQDLNFEVAIQLRDKVKEIENL